jgi:high-affinity iron transporter
MLLTSVIIILREVLEAALLISILLAMTRFQQLPFRWFYLSLAAGIAGSILYGTQLAAISNAFDGVGQELLNAALQIAIYLLLIGIAALLIVRHYSRARFDFALLVAMTAAVALAVLREGSEIFIYLSAFRQQPDAFVGVINGALIGAGIGFSIGALFYYLLLSLPRRRTLLAACALLTLVAGAMCSQAARELIQADWLPAQAPLWNTSALVAEDSIAGQLLYALIGYEATPSPLEVFIYIASISLMALLQLLTWRVHRKNKGSLDVQVAG